MGEGAKIFYLALLTGLLAIMAERIYTNFNEKQNKQNYVNRFPERKKQTNTETMTVSPKMKITEI